MSADAQADALQTCLAGEHAAVWVLALLGARTSQSTAPTLYAALRASYAWHTEVRDDLTATIAGLGLTPVAAAAAYDAPTGIATPTGVAAAALAVERACAQALTTVVAATTGSGRDQAVARLAATAVRELAFGGTTEVFPGYDPPPDRR